MKFKRQQTGRKGELNAKEFSVVNLKRNNSKCFDLYDGYESYYDESTKSVTKAATKAVTKPKLTKPKSTKPVLSGTNYVGSTHILGSFTYTVVYVLFIKYVCLYE